MLRMEHIAKALIASVVAPGKRDETVEVSAMNLVRGIEFLRQTGKSDDEITRLAHSLMRQ
jgi:hypothetical protein